MRITITIPDDVFQSADATARRRGVTRSQLVTEAIRRYLGPTSISDLTDEEWIERVNAICDTESTKLDPDLAELQWESLAKEPWE